MADDERPAAHGEEAHGEEARDEEVAGWLAVQPLDDVTRRRLVSTALRETAGPPVSRPSRPWRWIAAAAVIVVAVVGGVALLTANGGKDDQVASRVPRSESVEAGQAAPKAAGGAAAALGDFGNLDDAANRDRLRAAFSQSAGDSSTASSDTRSSTGAAAAAPDDARSCDGFLPGGTVIARATGTLDGRPATVVLVEHTDGAREVVVILTDPCEVRDLP